MNHLLFLNAQRACALFFYSIFSCLSSVRFLNTKINRFSAGSTTKFFTLLLCPENALLLNIPNLKRLVSLSSVGA